MARFGHAASIPVLLATDLRVHDPIGRKWSAWTRVGYGSGSASISIQLGISHAHQDPHAFPTLAPHWGNVPVAHLSRAVQLVRYRKRFAHVMHASLHVPPFPMPGGWQLYQVVAAVDWNQSAVPPVGHEYE